MCKRNYREPEHSDNLNGSDSDFCLELLCCLHANLFSFCTKRNLCPINTCDTCNDRGLEGISPKKHSNLFRKCAPTSCRLNLCGVFWTNAIYVVWIGVKHATIGLEGISPKMQSNLFRKCEPPPVTDMYVCVTPLLALIALITSTCFYGGFSS
jgi:hypothetical protein